MDKKKKILVILFILLSIFLSACDYGLMLSGSGIELGSGNNKEQMTEYKKGKTYIEAIDIGQGDAFLISNKEFGNILVDTGDTKYNKDDYLVDYLKSKGVKKLDAIIISHAHMDHIGGMDKILDNFEIGSVYMPKIAASTKTYKNMLRKIKAKGILIDEAKDGVAINLSKGNSIKFISPDKNSNKDSIDEYASVFILNSYGKKMLFTGDIPSKVEKVIAKKAGDIDILKVSHHGSKYSSKLSDLKVLKPEYAVISVGEKNKYGHPTKEALTNLKKAGAKIYRTDKEGHVTVIIDNKGKVEITTTKGN